MTNIAEVRDGLAVAIRAGTGLRCFAYAGTTLPHPCGIVTPQGYDPRMVLGKSKATHEFSVTVFVGSAAERSAQQRCDRLREASGTESIVAAVEDSTNWPVTVDYASVTFVGPVSEEIVAEESLMTFEVDIEVVF